MKISTVSANPSAGRMAWGPSPLPVGHLLIGTVNTTGALLLSMDRHCYVGNAGAIQSLPSSTLAHWARSLRAERGLDDALAHAEVSPRTWEGYEQGRPIPLEVIYRLVR